MDLLREVLADNTGSKMIALAGVFAEKLGEGWEVYPINTFKNLTPRRGLLFVKKTSELLPEVEIQHAAYFDETIEGFMIRVLKELEIE